VSFKLSLQINLAQSIYLHQVRANKIQHIPVKKKVVEILLQGLRTEDHHHYFQKKTQQTTLLQHLSKEGIL